VAYRADLEIAVKGAQELKRLQDQVSATSKLVDGLNNYLSNIGDGGVVRNINNLNAAVAETAAVFNKAALDTDEAATAARKYVQATDAQNAGLRERISLLAKIRTEERITKPGDAGTGQQTPALPPQLIRTYEIGKNWVKFFQDAAAVAVDLRARSLNTQKNWNDFFATAAQAAVNVKANALNTKKSWNDFFAAAAQAAVNVKANALNAKTSWNKFFAEAPGERRRLKQAGGGGGGGGGGKPNRLESIALGVGFPLLFGGGGGEVLGSLVGSFVGSGFGGQIFGGAIGGIIDDFTKKAGEIGAALNPATKNIETLVTALGGTTTAAGKYITKLEELGRTKEALSAATAELERLVGREGVDALKTFGAESGELDVLFGQAMTQMQASVAALITSSGILRKVIEAVEYGVLLRQAEASQDPRAKALVEERNTANRPGFLGGSPQKVFEANEKLVQLQKSLNQEKVKQVQIQTDLIIKEENYYASLKQSAEFTAQINRAREAANSQVLATQIQELEQRKQLTGTLTGELGLIDAISVKKKQSAADAFTAAQSAAESKVQLAKLDLDELKRQQERGTLTNEEAIKLSDKITKARKLYEAEVATTQENLRGAAAIQQGAAVAAELEKRQQTVAAYTEQYASAAGRATNSLNEAAAAVQNQASYSQALYQAQTTLNNIQIQSLQTALSTTKDTRKRAEIIGQIKDLEIANAVIAYQSAVSQIQAQVESLRISYRQVEVKYRELQAVVSIAKAQGLLTQSHLDALDAQKSALRIAAGNLETAIKTGNVNIQVAQSVRNAAIGAAELRAQTQGAAEAAGQYAGSLQSAAEATASMNASRNINTPGFTLQGFSQLEPWMEREIAAKKQAAIAGSMGGDAFASYVKGVSAELQARTAFQKVIDAKRMEDDRKAKAAYYAQTATPSTLTPGLERIRALQAERTAAASNPSTASPQINVTTGPVMQQNGQNYVTMQDFEQGLQAVSSSVLTNNRSAGGRRYAGVR
jgi:hypothetical protein